MPQRFMTIRAQRRRCVQRGRNSPQRSNTLFDPTYDAVGTVTLTTVNAPPGNVRNGNRRVSILVRDEQGERRTMQHSIGVAARQ
jgi:hypothetical protein